MAIGLFTASDAILTECSPLLEEKRNALLVALTLDVQHPLFLHRARLVAALSPDNDPINVEEVEVFEVGSRGSQDKKRTGALLISASQGMRLTASWFSTVVPIQQFEGTGCLP